MTASLRKFPIKGAFTQSRNTRELCSNGLDNRSLVFIDRLQTAAVGLAQRDLQQCADDCVVHESGRLGGDLKCAKLC
ncbi:hypothetical protein D9M71_716440 [compost metagenome]